MNQVQVPRCQDVATASGNPLECFQASKTGKKCEKCLWALGPPGALGPLWGLNILSLDEREGSMVGEQGEHGDMLRMVNMTIDVAFP